MRKRSAFNHKPGFLCSSWGFSSYHIHNPSPQEKAKGARAPPSTRKRRDPARLS